MKHYSLIVFFAFSMISCSSLSQLEGEAADGAYSDHYENGTLKETGLIKQGGMQGNWKFYDPEGNIMVDGFYRNGEMASRDTLRPPVTGRVGKWTFYYPGGNVMKVGSFKDDLMAGLWQFYNEDGTLEGKGLYIGGNGTNMGSSGVPRHGRHGAWEFFYGSGKVRSYYEYTNGTMNGKSLSYYESGNIRGESFYRDGKKDSSEYGLYDSGQQWYRLNYENGERIGTQNEWYENGQAMSTWTFSEGQPHGKQAGWYDNGEKMYERTFDQGKEIGLSQAWFEDGKMQYSESFIEGVKDGTAKAWYKNGQLKYTVDYSDGNIENNITIWAEDGTLSTDSFVKIETSLGTFVVDLFEAEAPLHAENFKNLARSNSFDGIYFHRIIPEFVAQGGDPLTRDNEDREDDGQGGIGKNIKAEIGLPHLRGSIGAARDQNPEKSSSGSQFYICLKKQPQLDSGYTVFGTVLLGMEVVDKMATFETDERDNPIEPIVITHTEVASSF